MKNNTLNNMVTDKKTIQTNTDDTTKKTVIDGNAKGDSEIGDFVKFFKTKYDKEKLESIRDTITCHLTKLHAEEDNADNYNEVYELIEALEYSLNNVKLDISYAAAMFNDPTQKLTAKE